MAQSPDSVPLRGRQRVREKSHRRWTFHNASGPSAPGFGREHECAEDGFPAFNGTAPGM